MSNKLLSHSWYHGAISRVEAERILTGERPGLFLVRDSSSIPGDYVLSVSESGKVSHYIMNNLGGAYRIGDQTFDDLPSIVEFYKKHFLDTTTLVEPAIRPGSDTAEQTPRTSSVGSLSVRAKYNFPGNDADDLPFKKGDILTVVKKEEDQWWIAKDSSGREGMIPVPYVEEFPAPSLNRQSFPATRPPGGNKMPSRYSVNTDRLQGGTLTYAQPSGTPVKDQPALPIVPPNCTTPFFVEAVQDRNPNIYDPAQLKFKKGERLEVLNMKDDGTWEGRVSDGRTGLFPFSYVKLLDTANGTA